MEIIAQNREIKGKSVKNLRKQGLTPAVIFGKDMESISITINTNDFIRLYNKAGDTSLIDIKIEGNGTKKVLVKEVTYDPVKDTINHVAFYKPNLKIKTTANIPLEFINKEQNELLKSNQAVLITLHDQVEVSALPADLPHSFDIDVSLLSEVGQGITVAEINVDKSKVEITYPEQEELIVKLDYATQLEQESEVDEEEAIQNLQATSEKEETE
mgnify:CR=1 FL=1